jgi:hypothetical protein
MFSRWIVTNIISSRGTLHCRKTRIPFGDQLVICGLYIQAKIKNAFILCIKRIIDVTLIKSGMCDCRVCSVPALYKTSTTHMYL